MLNGTLLLENGTNRQIFVSWRLCKSILTISFGSLKALLRLYKYNEKI